MKNCRLIYRSTATDEIPSNEDLLKLEEEAVENNRRDAITGMLILIGSEFLQVLEGPSQAVNALFQRISRDTRHQTVELIQFEETDSPACFEDWNMRLVDLLDLPMKQRQLFMDKYDHDDGVVRIPDKLDQVIELLLDAKSVCLNQVWKS